MHKVNVISSSCVLLLFAMTIEARIWFVGDKMPGSNRTIADEPTSTPSWAPPVNMDRLEKIIGRGVTTMALSMEHVIGTDRDNFIFAPVSVAAALSVLLLGAAGKTAAEIAYFLGLLAGVDFVDRSDLVHSQLGRYFSKFESQPGVKLGTELAFANAIFVQEGFPIKPKFDKSAREVYKCEVSPLDFFRRPEEARKVVNDWVSNRTHGRIKQILSSQLSPATKVIVSNALYFNGQWEYPFPKGIKIRSFQVSENESIPMPMMVNAAILPNHQTKEYQIFGMPYKGGDLVMYMILPKTNIHQFVSNLTAESIENMINQTKESMFLYIVPRMKMESTINFGKHFQNLGIDSLFDPHTADLSGIADNVYVNDIVHKVEIQVTENGTEASAGTVATLSRGGTPWIRIDRPFLFFVYHNPTNTIIFWGSVYKPTPFFDDKVPH